MRSIAIRILPLFIVLTMLFTIGCGDVAIDQPAASGAAADVADAQDVSKKTGDITYYTTLYGAPTGYRYLTSVTIGRVKNGFPAIYSNAANVTFEDSPRPEASILMQVLPTNGSGAQYKFRCALFMNWAQGGTFPGTAPAGVPYVRSTPAPNTTRLTVNPAFSWCMINGVDYLPMSAGAVEYWDNSYSPSVGGAVGYFVFRFPGWFSNPTIATVIRN